MQPGTLYYGDCLEWMEKWPDECVDLIYLDPPFNSKAHYNILYSTKSAGDAQIRAFEDTWQWDEAAGERMARFEGAIAHPLHGPVCGLFQILGPSGMMAYLTYMAERLLPTRRLLRPTGSIYLHCDPTASHYLKVLMDAIYGGGSFRNEVVWRIGWVSGYKTQKRGWIRNHDTLLYYIKSPAAAEQFNKEYIPYPDGYTRRDGQLPTGKGIPIEDTWNCSDADVLDSIMIKSFSTEKLGYPTQKPLALLERIIKASSNEGDVILDPFCGCGTAIEAAHRLNRQWAGIDISPFAIDLIRDRRLKDLDVPAEGIPSSLESARMLAREKPFAFETWAVTRLPGFAPNQKQTGDGGVDGRGKLADQPDDLKSRLALAQVKGGQFTASGFRDFLHVLHRDKAAVGCFLTLDPAPARVRAEAKRFGTLTVSGQRYDRLHPFSIRDYFEDRPPHLPAMLDPYTGKPVYQMALL